MRKIIVVALSGVLALVSVFTLSGCGINSVFESLFGSSISSSSVDMSSSDYAGTWECVAMDTGDGVIEVDEYGDLLGYSGPELATIELSDDGSVSLIIMNTDALASENVSISWQESDNGVDLINDENGAVAYELTYDSEKGWLEMVYGEQSIYFAKSQ